MLTFYERKYIRNKNFFRGSGPKTFVFKRFGKYVVKTDDDGNVVIRSQRFAPRHLEDLKSKQSNYKVFKPDLKKEELQIFASKDPDAEPQAVKKRYVLKWTF